MEDPLKVCMQFHPNYDGGVTDNETPGRPKLGPLAKCKRDAYLSHVLQIQCGPIVGSMDKYAKKVDFSSQ